MVWLGLPHPRPRSEPHLIPSGLELGALARGASDDGLASCPLEPDPLEARRLRAPTVEATATRSTLTSPTSFPFLVLLAGDALAFLLVLLFSPFSMVLGSQTASLVLVEIHGMGKLA